MLTVILFHESERERLMKYQFIFVNFQADHQIALCEWTDGMKEEDAYQELDSLTAEHHEWKLLIFGGRLPEGRNLSADQFGGFKNLLKIYTGSYTKHRVDGFLPVSTWFVGYQEKQTGMRSSAAAFKTVDKSRELGSTFRAIWFEVNNSSKMQEQFDLFRMACGILVLALNDIPSYFLECGYLYQMDLVIQRADFARYVVSLREQLRQISDLTQTAHRELEEDYQNQSIYPDADLKKSALLQSRRKLVGSVAREEITVEDLSNGFSLENKLDINRKWLRSQLYFPKGVLQQELGKVQASVDAAPGAEYRLNEAAKDRVERELLSTLEKMRTQRKKQSQQNQTLKKIGEMEKDLLLKKERWRWGGEKWIVLAVLSAAEILLLLPFCFALFSSAFSIVLGVHSLLTGVPACFCALFWGISRLEFWGAANGYEKLLKQDIDGKQEERLRYMEETMDLIAQYQYGIRLQKKEQGRLAVLEQRKKTLLRHMDVLENGQSICRQLSVLLGEEEMAVPPAVRQPDIDFLANPNEVEYYWVPYRHSKNMADLNRSGHLVNAFFSFVSEITLRKTPDAGGESLPHL